MDIARTEAELQAQGLEVNQSIRTECPACNRRTFSVTRLATGVVWNCFRASCNTYGSCITSASLVAPARRTTKLRPYTERLSAIDVEDHGYFWHRFGLFAEPYVNIRVTDDGRYAFPIRDFRGYERGILVRDPVWKGSPEPPRSPVGGAKALTYMHTEGPVQSWHTVPEERRLVLVEDSVSAMCAQQEGLSALALLGTHLNNDKVREIGLWGPKEVIIALDADATAEAFKLAKKWGLAFPKTRVCILAEDLKDTPQEDIRYVLGMDE